MSRLLTVIVIVFWCCAAVFGQAAGSRKATLPDMLLARAQLCGDTWNNKDVDRMRRLHADDVSIQLYGIGEEFGTVETLLDDIARTKFWNLSWSIKIEDSRVRLLGKDAALVTFHLVGQETNSDGGSRRYSGAHSLIFQRQKNVWKVVHVHSSHGPMPGSASTTSTAPSWPGTASISQGS
ncbi:MAG: nuclear transport factor 2 family protein [Acidobacteriota bacterium]